MQGLAYIPAIILVVVGTLLGKTPGLILVTLLIVPVILFLSTRWAIDIPCIIVEELRAGPSLGRSWVLTEKDFWHVLGTILTSGLLVYLVTLLPGVVIIFVSSQFTSLADLGPLLSALITQVGTLISTPLSISDWLFMLPFMCIASIAAELTKIFIRNKAAKMATAQIQ